PDVESVHFRFVTNKMNERDNGKSELQTEDNLTQDKQFSRDLFAEDGNHDNGRNDGDETCDDTAHPRLDSEIEITFHNDLPRECSGDGRALPGANKCHCK